MAVSAVLDVREVKRLRASWELWLAIAEDDGIDSEAALLDAMPIAVLAQARLALWGSPIPAGENDWLRIVHSD